MSYKSTIKNYTDYYITYSFPFCFANCGPPYWALILGKIKQTDKLGRGRRTSCKVQDSTRNPLPLPNK